MQVFGMANPEALLVNGPTKGAKEEASIIRTGSPCCARYEWKV